jgi:hypothetical protein
MHLHKFLNLSRITRLTDQSIPANDYIIKFSEDPRADDSQLLKSFRNYFDKSSYLRNFLISSFVYYCAYYS